MSSDLFESEKRVVLRLINFQNLEFLNQSDPIIVRPSIVERSQSSIDALSVPRLRNAVMR